MNTEDRKAELEEELSQLSSEAAMWKALLDHPAWEHYFNFIEKQMNMRQVTVCLTPINTEYSAFAQEFFKGEFSGMRKALTLPATEMEQANQRQVIIRKELENYESETAVDSEFASRIDGEPFGE